MSSDKHEYYKELVRELVQKQKELENIVDDLETKITTAEEERDFYFEKLRDIEDFCDYREWWVKKKIDNDNNHVNPRHDIWISLFVFFVFYLVQLSIYFISL